MRTLLLTAALLMTLFSLPACQSTTPAAAKSQGTPLGNTGITVSATAQVGATTK